MLHFLSKFIPPFLYPLGLVCALLLFALVQLFPRRWRYASLVLALGILLLGSNRIVAYSLTRSLEWRNPPAATGETIPDYDTDVIVVLGGGTRGQGAPRPIPEMNEGGDRLLYAAWLYQQLDARGDPPQILVSGGNVAPWTGPNVQTEAQDMAAILNIMGVPSDAIWLEQQSRNTYENGVESRKILADKQVDRILLITSATHMTRARKVFEAQGFDVIPLPTDYIVTYEDWDFYMRGSLAVQLFNILPQVDYLSLTTRCLKEYLGLLYYGLRGWV